MAQQHYQIVGIGAALVDTEIKLSDAELQQLNIDKGLMTLVEQADQQRLLDTLNRAPSEVHQASGGSAGNTLYATGLFGASSGFVCKVADDDNGELYSSDMQNAGVTTSQQNHTTSDDPTGQCLVMVTPDAQRSMCTYLGASASIDADNVPSDWTADIGYIESYLATSPNGCNAVATFSKQIRDSGGKIALSLSDPGIVEFFGAQINEMVSGNVDIVFCNRDEAQKWTGATSNDEVFEGLGKFATLSIMTDGANGAFIHNDGETSHIEGLSVEVLDTNGAGDIFAGAFLTAYTKGFSLQDAGNFACKTASEVIGVFAPRLSRERYLAIAKTLS